MRVLITAGGTSEKIDEVRKITNLGTGRLGSLTADEFLKNEDTAVTYVCSENAVLPRNRRAEIMRVDSVRNLKITLERLLRERAFDAVIHSMAVSDYCVKYSASIDELACFLAGRLPPEGADLKTGEQAASRIRAALAEYSGLHASKISSDIENLFLCLEKTPKVIGMFKELQPDTVLVGFKLLACVEESELLRAAKKLMRDNGCDFVLANDKKDVHADRHAAILVGPGRDARHLHTKSEIAAAIASCVMQRIREKTR